MAVRPVRIWPDPMLSQKAKPVVAFDGDTRVLVADLFDTMYAENGIGLAANQIGVSLRALVIDLDPKKQAVTDPEVRADLEQWGYRAPRAFINPQIVSAEGQVVWEEGCLSVPGVTEEVKRKEHVVVRAQDVDGSVFELTMHGLYAVALQHELDHLNGRVFVDYLSRLKLNSIRKKMVRLKASDEPLPATGRL
ncbi:MAG: peptide deformylase [Deltaproteobacteria bacterium]|nr:MAG: peptide deformylase [Deltaproteobacteria bacterium]